MVNVIETNLQDYKERIKQFLKPNWKKIFLTIIIFSLLPVFYCVIPVICKFGPCPPIEKYVSLIALVLVGYFQYLQFSIFPFFGLAIAYFIGCLVNILIEKVFVERKKSTLEFFAPTKGKTILSVLGWITVGLILLHYLSNFFGGTANFPPILRYIFDFFTYISLILLPFSVITFRILYPTTIVTVMLFSAFIKVPLSLTTPYGLEPSNLTFLGGIFCIIFLIIEWYVVSCLIIYAYDKFRI